MTGRSKELIAFEGRQSKGDPCEAMAYHGFNGIEQQVVSKIAEWITRDKGVKQKVRLA